MNKQTIISIICIIFAVTTMVLILMDYKPAAVGFALATGIAGMAGRR